MLRQDFIFTDAGWLNFLVVASLEFFFDENDRWRKTQKVLFDGNEERRGRKKKI